MDHVIRKAIDDEGRTVEHRFFVRSESDGREQWSEAADSPRTIKAIPGETGRGLGFERSPIESKTQAARVYHVRDDVADLADGGGDGASRLVDGGAEWIVMQKDDLGNGSYRLLCWRDE